jgi:hypothetical protein
LKKRKKVYIYKWRKLLLLRSPATRTVLRFGREPAWYVARTGGIGICFEQQHQRGRYTGWSPVDAPRVIASRQYRSRRASWRQRPYACACYVTSATTAPDRDVIRGYIDLVRYPALFYEIFFQNFKSPYFTLSLTLTLSANPSARNPEISNALSGYRGNAAYIRTSCCRIAAFALLRF